MTSARTGDVAQVDTNREDRLKEVLTGHNVPLSIWSLVPTEYHDWNVRLVNCFIRSQAQNLGEFLALGEEGRIKLTNYGRKSELELASLLSTLLRQDAIAQPKETIDGAEPNAFEECFNRLRSSDSPWDNLRSSEWHSFKTKVGDGASIRIKEVAKHIGRNWPTASGTETIGDFLPYRYSDIASLNRIGRVKRDTLALVGAYLAAYPDYAKGRTKCFERLRKVENPWKNLRNSEWLGFRSSLEGIKSLKIVEVAQHLGCRWPSKLAEEIVGDFISTEYSLIPRIPRMGRVKLNTLALVLAFLSENPNFGREPLTSFDEILQLPQFNGLSAVEEKILERRLLKPEPRQATLEELAQEESVTRERIRQIEATMLQSIRDGTSGARVAELLARKQSDIFSALTSSELVLREADLPERSLQVSGPTLLAIYVEAPTLSSWLDQRFERFGHVWFDPSKTDLGAIRKKMKSLSPLQLPCPEALIQAEFRSSQQELRAWCLSTKDAVLWNGYVLSKNEARQRRAVIAHRICAKRRLNLFSPAKLLTFWPHHIENSRHFERLLTDSIRRTPSLFLSTSQAAVPINLQSVSKERLVLSQRKSSESLEAKTIAGTIVKSPFEKIEEFVLEYGPISQADIRLRKVELERRLGLSEISINVYLGQNPSTFVRMAPGIYEHVSLCRDQNRIEKVRARQMDISDVRRYCITRLAGESAGALFPLWDSEQERRWVNWGKDTLESNLFESLLFISDPTKWSGCPRIDVAYWLERKARARWWLPMPDFSGPATSRPALRSVFFVGNLANQLGEISWIRANHYLGATQVVERKGHSAVVLGTALGLLNPSSASGFQRLKPSRDFDEQWNGWQNLLTKQPDANWSNSLAEAKLKSSLDQAQRGHLGWVKSGDLSALINSVDEPIFDTELDLSSEADAQNDEIKI